MAQSMRESNALLLNGAARPVAQPLSDHLRGVRLLQLSMATGDLLVIVAATGLAAVGRSSLTIFATANDLDVVAQAVGPWIVLAWMGALAGDGSYRQSVLGVGTREYARVCSATGFTAGLVGILSYLASFELSRGYFVLLFGLGLPALLLWRWACRHFVHHLHLKGHLLTRVVIAGEGSHVDDVACVLDREAWLGYRIVGALLPPWQRQSSTGGGVPVIGTTDEAVGSVFESRADLMVVAEGALPSSADFRRIAWDLEGHHVQMAVVPSLSDISSGRVTMQPVGGLPLVHVGQPQSLHASRVPKRLFDLVGATVLLLLGLPLMALAAVAIKLEDRGPVLFRQTRVGRDGALFECLKFRSMVTDAEARLSGVSHLNANADGVLFKAQHDPRITRVGRLIRRFSIDELPQLVNVVGGDMSLVGPRPALPSEVSRYAPEVERRLHVRPGLTGLWQVSGRSDLSWDDTVRLDLYYVDNWSIVQDLSILAKTFHAVVRPRGAY